MGARDREGALPEPQAAATAAPSGRIRMRLLLSVLLLAAAATLVFGLDLHQQLSLQALREHRQTLGDWVAGWPLTAPLVFVAVYALSAVLVPPTTSVMMVTAGFLFGTVVGTAVAVASATAGATLFYLVARFLAGERVRRRVTSAVHRVHADFHGHALSYVLVLRLVPLLPFWLVNLASAVLHVPLGTFVLGTFLGIIPVTTAFAMFGAGLGDMLDGDETISLRAALNPQIVAGLLGLALLALCPVVYRQWRRRSPARAPEQRTGD